MIWLVDYTHYEKPIHPRLAAAKQDYFRMKSYARHRKIGPTAPVQTRVFGTGLLRIATILHRNQIPVRYLHYNQLISLLKQGAALPETVAFSAICPTVNHCESLAAEIKQRSPNTTVILGGVHANLNPETTASRFPVFDRVSLGHELAAAEAVAGRPLQPVPAPYVDYALLPYPLQAYAINTVSTVGCPFRCDYCADGRAPHYIASPDGQLSTMKKLLPPRTLVHFFDSVLGYSTEGAHQVCRAIQKADHPFLLSCDMRAELLTPELLSEMEAAGFVEVRLGMESADPELLVRNGRTLLPDRFAAQIAKIRQHSNMYITLYSITGLPGTTVASHEKTLRCCEELLREQLVDEIKNAQYVPYPTEGIDYAARGVTILNHNWTDYDRQSFPVYRTAEMSSQELWELYLHTAEDINRSWLKGLGFSSFDQVPVIEGYYSEYVQANYLGKKEEKGGV